jgi:cytochrome bd-type quinol oxidase subunit 2
MLSAQDRRILGGLYPVALLLILSPLLDLATAVWPVRPTEVSWRFGTFGLITSALITPILGLAVLQGVAAFLEKFRAVRVVSAVNVLVGVLLLVGTALFLLDAVQLRGTVTEAAKQSYDAAALKALVTALLEVVVVLWIGIVGMRVASADSKRAGSRDRGSPLVVGRGAES